MRADLALVGFGNVGRRFARLLDDQRHNVRNLYGLETRIVGIATGCHGSAFSLRDGIDAVQAARLVESGDALTGLHTEGSPPSSREIAARLAESRADLRVIVETTTLDIRNGRPAIDHVEDGLRAGCHVVTANKGPIAFAYRRLAMMAEEAGISFLFEGTVMDGVPVFNLVREALPAVSVLGFRGVINSTTNHILTALERGEAFGPALAQMRAAGIAEADASLDLEGWDAAAKAAALANVLLDADVTPHDVDRTGVTPDLAGPARAAVARGTRLRLVASARRGERPTVRPVELTDGDVLAGLQGMANAIVLDTDLLGEIAVTQLSGSLTQTAYALMSDLVTIGRRAGMSPRTRLIAAITRSDVGSNSA